MLKISCLAIIILLGLYACEQDAENVKLPSFEQKIVIKAFITPSDTMSYIYVSSNRPVFGDLNQKIELSNPKAWLSDGEKEILLDTAKNGFKFSHKKMPVIPGKTYSIKVTTDNGLLAEASCTVPLNHMFNIKIDTFFTTKIENGFIYRSIKIIASFNDLPGVNNYYRIAASYYTSYYSYTYPDNQKILIKQKIPIMFDPKFVSDQNQDGSDLFFHSNNNGFGPVGSEERDATFYLLNTDKAYYDYHISLNNYSDNDDPFTEVSPVYSNIKGGLGIFSSYTIDSVQFKLK